MGHSPDDYAMDAMYDAMAEQEEENLQTELIAKHAEDVADALVDAKGFSATQAKVDMLTALTKMTGHTVSVEPDAGATELNLECARLLPPADHPRWGDRKKPRHLIVNLTRMAKDGLVKNILGTRDQIVGFRLTVRGAAYLVNHGKGSMEDLVDILRDRRPEETTNVHYLQQTGQDVSHLNLDGSWRWDSHPAWNESYMAAVAGVDGRRRNAARYQSLGPAGAGYIMSGVIKRDGGRCLRGLMTIDRSLLIYGLLAESGVDNKAVARTLHDDIEAERVWEKKVEKIVKIHQAAEVSTSDRAEDYINESICRFAWMLLSNHVDHRVNVDRPRPSALPKTRKVAINSNHPALKALEAIQAQAEQYQAMQEALQRQVRAPLGGWGVDHNAPKENPSA